MTSATKSPNSKPPYKSPSGHWKTLSLFHEVARNLEIENRSGEAVFSLYKDYPGKINARKTFVELGDPTGYKWAMKYLGDYEHWTVLMKCKWFAEAYDVWMNELKMKVRSEALDVLRETAQSGTAQATVAAKYLAGFEWEKTENRGRPSKAEIGAKAKEAVKWIEELQDDAARIGLKAVK